MTPLITFRLSPEMQDKLKRVAANAGKTMTDLVRDFVNELEDPQPDNSKSAAVLADNRGAFTVNAV